MHATVAVAAVLAQERHWQDGTFVFETQLRPRRVRASEAGIDVELDEPIVLGRTPPPQEVGAVLGLAAARVGARLPLTGVFVARPKLLVEVPDETTLDALDPEFDALWRLCDRYETTGVYAFTLAAAGADVSARHFPRRAGYVEDAATGTATGALAAYLSRQQVHTPGRALRIAQGRALGRPA